MNASAIPKGLLQWLHEGRILAGQLEASGPGRTAWIGIYPLDLSNPHTQELLHREGIALIPGATPRPYRLQTFEIADGLRETFFGDRDMKNQWSCIVIGDEALFDKLAERNIDVGCLDSPRHVDYPL
jgi:hypothetical protein